MLCLLTFASRLPASTFGVFASVQKLHRRLLSVDTSDSRSAALPLCPLAIAHSRSNVPWPRENACSQGFASVSGIFHNLYMVERASQVNDVREISFTCTSTVTLWLGREAPRTCSCVRGRRQDRAQATDESKTSAIFHHLKRTAIHPHSLWHKSGVCPSRSADHGQYPCDHRAAVKKPVAYKYDEEVYGHGLLISWGVHLRRAA